MSYDTGYLGVILNFYTAAHILPPTDFQKLNFTALPVRLKDMPQLSGVPNCKFGTPDNPNLYEPA